MPKIPYVTQQDSPNLVIVPTDSCYEPSPKKSRGDNTNSHKVQEYIKLGEKNVFVSNVSKNVKPHVTSVNNNVLIDVSKVKKQPNSWASNFLQSIGGTASKLPRASNWQSSASKLSLLRNQNIQPMTNLGIAQPKKQTDTQLISNTEANQLKVTKKLILDKTSKKAAQLKSNNDLSSSNGNSQTSKPKPKKEVYQPIKNEELFEPKTYNEYNHLKSNKEVCQKQPKKDVSQVKSSKEITKLKPKKQLTPLISNKESIHMKKTFPTKVHKKTTQLKACLGTCQTKVPNKTAPPNVHKEISQPKLSKQSTKKTLPTIALNTQNIISKKLKNGEKKQKKSEYDKKKKTPELEGPKTKTDFSKSRQSISPIKSIVKKIKNYHLNDSQHTPKNELDYHLSNLERLSHRETGDLRSKLKRKAPKNEIYSKEHESRYNRKHKNMFPTVPNGKGFVPDENLIISFDTENDKEEVVEKKKTLKAKTRKHKKCKKIKLEINIVYENDTDTSNSESSTCDDKEDNESVPDTTDLSFLDDFNVDEIAESLNDCQSSITETISKIDSNDNEILSKLNVESSKTDTEKAISRNDESITNIENNNNINSSDVRLYPEISLLREESAKELKLQIHSLSTHYDDATKNNDNGELKSQNNTRTSQLHLDLQKTDDVKKEVFSIDEYITNFESSIRNKNDSNITGIQTCDEVTLIKEDEEALEFKQEIHLHDANKNYNVNDVTINMIEHQREVEIITEKTDTTPEEVKSSSASAQLNVPTSKDIHKNDSEIVETTNINNDDKSVINLTDQNITPSSYLKKNLCTDIKCNEKSEAANSFETVLTVDPSICLETGKDKSEVILIEDSDNDMADDKGKQRLVEKDVIDLTFVEDCIKNTKSKEEIVVNAMKPKVFKADSGPILILDTDYDEVISNANSNGNQNIKNSSKICPEPIDVIKKHLFCNLENKTHVSEQPTGKPSMEILLEQKENTKKNNQKKSTGTHVDNIFKSDSKHAEIKSTTAKNHTSSIEDEKKSITNKVVPVASKDLETAGLDQAKSKIQAHKNGQHSGEVKSSITENQVSTTNERNHGDSRIEQTPKINSQDLQDNKQKTINKVNYQNVNATLQAKESIKVNAEAERNNKNNETTPKHEKLAQNKDGKRTEQNQAKTNTQGHNNGKLNGGVKSAINANKISPVKETNEIVNKGDTKTEQNQPKTNSQDVKDGNANIKNNINSQNLDAKLQPKVPNKSRAQVKSDSKNNETTSRLAKVKNIDKAKPVTTKGLATAGKDQGKTSKQIQKEGKLNREVKSATVENQISLAKENDDKDKFADLGMWVVNKGDRTTQHTQPKITSHDKKDVNPKPLDNVNSKNANAKFQAKVPFKANAEAKSNKKLNERDPRLAKTTLINDQIAQKHQTSQDMKDVKSKPMDNINSKNVNAKFQAKVPSKANAEAKSTNKLNERDPRLAKTTLIKDQLAQKLQNRMQTYHGTVHNVSELLHRGRFSTIYRCDDVVGAPKTVKIVQTTWKLGASKENMMTKLKNGVPEDNFHCVRYFYGFSIAGHWCFVMEYYPKNLQQVLNVNKKSFHIDRVQDLSGQLIAAATILRNNNIVHSDIHPRHILMNESETRIKLCGFDQAFYYNGGGTLIPNLGTVNYRAPELILGFPSDYRMDVWAIALVMYQMATNVDLFPGYHNNDILYKQVCTVGSIPWDMLQASLYRNLHFMGEVFIRTVGSRGEGQVFVHEFFKKERIFSVLFQVYQKEWAKSADNQVQDRAKINAMGKLLNKMLVMDPRCRIAIEFVFADPFIYQMSN